MSAAGFSSYTIYVIPKFLGEFDVVRQLAKRNIGSVLFLVALLGVTACSRPDGSVEVHDPFETQNRLTHQTNKDLDRALVRPTSNTYGRIIPAPAQEGVANFASNIDTPRHIMNDILQGQGEDAGHNFFRFLVNTTIGLAGLFDPASSMGLEARPSDFGETLYTWGVPEGSYQELPVIGPSTERHTVGRVVDFVSSPIASAFGSGQQWIPPTSSVLAGLGYRYQVSSTIDAILYDSADSYAQGRSLYLQNRRFRLGAETDDFDFDPYEDFDE